MDIQNIKQKQSVLIFPAQIAAEMTKKQVCFLFSVTQVEDIVRELSVHPVPFSPAYAEGITQWHNQVLPVLSLEKMMGFAQITHTERSGTRLMMIRVPAENHQTQHIIIRVIPPVRILSLPISCTPLAETEWIPQKSLIRAVYEWDESYLVIVNMEKLLSRYSMTHHP